MHNQTDHANRPMRAGHAEKMASRVGSGGNVRSGESPDTSTFCACMGPQGADPLCPCEMRRAGLEPTPLWTPEKRAELEEAMRKIVEREEADLRSNV